MKKIKFYHCLLCGNIVTRDAASTEPPICCREPMELLEVHTAESSTEKHVPVITVNASEVIVTIGSIPHPMLLNHFITRVYLVTTEGLKSTFLDPEDEPMAKFTLEEGETVIGAYEYCNIHGLWYGEV